MHHYTKIITSNTSSKNFVKLSGFTENNYFLSFSINYFCLKLTRAKSEDLYNSSNTFAAYIKK